LAEAKAAGLAPGDGGRAAPEPWPFHGPVPGMPESELWREEWGRLGFLSGPPLMGLFRPSLPSGLPTSRDLDGLAGQEVGVAGLLALAERSFQGELRLTFLDEVGTFEVRKGGRDDRPPQGMGAWLVKGKVEDVYGAAVVRAARIERIVPAAVPAH